MENDLLGLKRKFEDIFNENDIYDCLKRGKDYILILKDFRDLTSDFYYNIAYYCEDLFIKGLSLENNEDRFYFNDFFGSMGIFFCDKYIKSIGVEVFNDEISVDFLIEMSMFYGLADRHDEKFDLLEAIVNNSDKNNLRIKAINQILKIVGLNKDIINKYKILKNSIM